MNRPRSSSRLLTLLILAGTIYFFGCKTIPENLPSVASVDKLPGTFSPALESMQIADFEEVEPGVWAASVGRNDSPTPMDLSDPPRTEALKELPPGDFPWGPTEVRFLVRDHRASVRLPLLADEKIYGFGLQFEGLQRRGQILHLRVDHYKSGKERTHAPVPFYISSRGYGVLFDTSRPISVYAGMGNRKDSPEFPTPRDRNTDSNWNAHPPSDAVEASVAFPGLSIRVFTGPDLLSVVRRYNLYSGGGCLPPRWGLGFWHRVRTNASSDEILAEVDAFRDQDFPLDVIGLEPGWHSKSYPCTFDWNQKNFPDPRHFLTEMGKRKVRVNLWENPYVSPDSSIYKAILPHTGSHTVWLGVVPDFSLEPARKIFAAHHATSHVDLGVSGYKIDEVDGYDSWLWPDHATFPSGIDGLKLRQIYGLLTQRTLNDVFRQRNQRTFGLVRASHAGASSLPFVLYSDHYDHKHFITALCNSGFSGLLWTPEIRSAKTPEEWVRRMQTVCFSPLAQLNGWSSRTKPWSRPTVNEAVKDVMQLRLRLLPYLYTMFARYRFLGTPPFRAMILEDGFGPPSETATEWDLSVAGNVTDQYMMGESILVAPFLAGQKERQVTLPKGKWFDFYDGSYAGDGELITIPSELSRIPLFVKDGSIVPMLEALTRTSTYDQRDTLILRHYGENGGKGLLYDDDGATFNFENGDRTWIEFQTTRNRDGSYATSVVQDPADSPFQWNNIEWVHMTETRAGGGT